MEERSVHKLTTRTKVVSQASLRGEKPFSGKLQSTTNADLRAASEAGDSSIEVRTSLRIDVEDQWIGDKIIRTRGIKWIIGSVSGLAAVFTCFAIWGLVLLGVNDEAESDLASAEGGTLSSQELSSIREQRVLGFLAADSVEEKVAFVRNPERVLPLMQGYYSKHPLVSLKDAEVSAEFPVVGDIGLMWQVMVKENEQNEEKEPSAYLVETLDDGTSLVDWEASVVYQPSDWSSFVAERKTGQHTFRVMIKGAQQDGFHGFEFADYSKYRCYQIFLGRGEEFLWAYTEIDSELDEKLVDYVTDGGRDNFNNKNLKSAVITLFYPEGAQSARCVHLAELVTRGWLQ